MDLNLNFATWDGRIMWADVFRYSIIRSLTAIKPKHHLVEVFLSTVSRFIIKQSNTF